jgi:hypothetical protein
MPRSQKLSFEDTKRLLDHSCNSSPSMTASNIADFLDVPASRISQGRSKEWRLSLGEANTLIEKYGQPKGKPGLFVRAEERENIICFIENEPLNSKTRHLKRISSLYCSSKFRNSLADKIKMIGEDDQLLSTYEAFTEDGDELLSIDERSDARKTRACKLYTSAEFRKEKLNKLLSVMRTPQFAQWLAAARLYLEKLREIYDEPIAISTKMGSTGFFDICEIHQIIPDGNNNHLPSQGSLDKLLEGYGLKTDSFFEMSLLLIGSLEQNFPGYGLLSAENGLISQDKEALNEVKEYVITGENIWSHEGAFTKPKVGEVGLESIFFPDVKNRPDWTYPLLENHNKPKLSNFKDETSMSVDRWTTYEVSLFLKDNCDYSLLLSLGNNENIGSGYIHFPERNIVIPNISGVQLFNELEVMRKWLTLPKLPLDEMKRDIASNGGYIPGAVVI